jgi:hypothetical protein
MHTGISITLSSAYGERLETIIKDRNAAAIGHRAVQFSEL